MTGMNMFWRGSVLDSKTFFAAAIELVMTMMLWTFSSSMVGIRPKHIAMSSASIEVTFIELACKRRMMEFVRPDVRDCSGYLRFLNASICYDGNAMECCLG